MTAELKEPLPQGCLYVDRLLKTCYRLLKLYPEVDADLFAELRRDVKYFSQAVVQGSWNLDDVLEAEDADYLDDGRYEPLTEDEKLSVLKKFALESSFEHKQEWDRLENLTVEAWENR